MSKEKNNKDLETQDNKYTQLSKENEIIEELINNSLLIKDIEDLEEEEEDDSYSEKDKITEEILDNKLSFIMPEENESKQNENKNYIKKNPQKIHKDIIENLLIELFEYHYNDISTEKKMNLGNKILESKYHIGFFCTKLNKNFSKYILLILEQKIYELIEHIEKIIKTKVKTVKDILEIKNSLKLTGRDVEKIFEKPFQRTQSFDISSVLIVLFISDILSDNKINLTDEEYEQIIQAESYDEKDRFEKYIEECKLLFEKIENGENGENDEDIEVYEEEKQIENIDDKNNNNNEKEEEEEQDKENEIKINEEKNDNNIKTIEQKKDIFIIEDIINKNKNTNTKNINTDNSINNENVKKNSNDNNKNKNNNTINDKNNIDNKIEKYSNIEDLVNYINGSDKKKKKKKKRKKKAKAPVVNIIEEEKENIYVKDDVFENFKSNLIHFSDNLEKVKKIKPKISEAFLEKLKLIN